MAARLSALRLGGGVIFVGVTKVSETFPPRNLACCLVLSIVTLLISALSSTKIQVPPNGNTSSETSLDARISSLLISKYSPNSRSVYSLTISSEPDLPT